jgi:hypothetical protein
MSASAESTLPSSMPGARKIAQNVWSTSRSLWTKVTRCSSSTYNYSQIWKVLRVAKKSVPENLPASSGRSWLKRARIFLVWSRQLWWWLFQSVGPLWRQSAQYLSSISRYGALPTGTWRTLSMILIAERQFPSKVHTWNHMQALRTQELLRRRHNHGRKVDPKAMSFLSFLLVFHRLRPLFDKRKGSSLRISKPKPGSPRLCQTLCPRSRISCIRAYWRLGQSK